MNRTSNWSRKPIDDTAGYDCMTPGVEISFMVDSDFRTIVLDAKDFGHPSFDQGLPAEALRLSTEALICHLADEIVTGMNARRDQRKLWVMEAPVLSTAHISEETNELFELTDDETMDRWQVYHINGGWMIYVGEEDDNILDAFPGEIQGLLRWCQQNKYTWLRLDQDGDTIDGLPTWDW